MDDEEDFDDFKPLEEQKMNFEKINIKTDGFTNTSNNKCIEESSSDEEIVDKYNKIVFFNEENLPKINKSENISDISDFSGITPLLTYDRSKKIRVNKIYDKADNKTYFHRIDSFTLPRTNSFKLYKYK
jgi:hypothetical protein